MSGLHLKQREEFENSAFARREVRFSFWKSFDRTSRKVCWLCRSLLFRGHPESNATRGSLHRKQHDTFTFKYRHM